MWDNMGMKIEDLRRKADAHRERGNLRLAEAYEREIHNAELLAKIHQRTEETTVIVKRRRYRVSLSYNDEGEWYANVHARGSILPDAHVSGCASREDCLAAVREALMR